MKNQVTLFLSFLFLVHISGIAQTGKITGKVIDAKTGETLPGASVLIDGTAKGAATDFDGNYAINSLAPGTYTILCKYISYADKKIGGIEVKAGDVTNVNISLEEPVGDTLTTVVITATLNKENTNTLLIMQKNNASMSDGVSAETIKKTPDRSTSDVLRRVSGAAIQDNKFAIVRGLNDRYNAAYLNGAPLPSSESDRKAFSFDIFPSNMLDNLVINKTATPDMPAEFGGGIIQINTKSIPEKNFQSFSAGAGYNTMTTGKERLTYKGGKTDWLGIDDGTRALPAAIPERESFPTLPAQQAELGKQIPNNWGTVAKKFSPNMNFQYSMGQSVKYKDRDLLGMVLALSYNRNYLFQTTNRRSYTSSSDLSIPSQQETDYLDKVYSTQTLGGALANFAVKINENNAISFKNLWSVNTEDRVIRRTGTAEPLVVNPLMVKSTALWFTSNQIYSGQLGGTHLLEKSKIKFEWVGAYSTIKRDIPDLRRTGYTRYNKFTDESNPNPKDTTYTANVASSLGPEYGGGMFYSRNREKIYSFRGDMTYPFQIGKDLKNEFKTGGSYQKRSRDFYARQMGFTKYNASGVSDSMLQLPEDQIFAAQNMGIVSSTTKGFKLRDGSKPTDTYNANSELTSAYVMLDNRYKSKLRLIWGARLESFVMHLNTILDNKQPFSLETQRIYVLPGLFGHAKNPPLIQATKMDVLPSFNAIWSLTEKQNIRACYSQTVNRPEFRELAPFAFYDFNTQFVYSGNDSLKRALIHNYDLRYEFYPGRGQILSATGFYKNFINPIEQISRADVTGEVSYKNVDKAKNYGFELEFRIVLGALLKKDSVKFLNNLTVFSNFAYIKSVVDLTGVIGAASATRSLQGQSPYIFNAGILYNDADKGISFAAVVNRVGQRIAIVGNVNEPDIWENGRTVLDLQLAKSLMKNRLSIALNARDILAQKQYFFQDRNNNRKLDKNSDDLIWITKFAPTFSLNVAYKF